MKFVVNHTNAKEIQNNNNRNEIIDIKIKSTIIYLQLMIPFEINVMFNAI